MWGVGGTGEGGEGRWGGIMDERSETNITQPSRDGLLVVSAILLN